MQSCHLIFFSSQAPQAPPRCCRHHGHRMKGADKMQQHRRGAGEAGLSAASVHNPMHAHMRVRGYRPSPYGLRWAQRRDRSTWTSPEPARARMDASTSEQMHAWMRARVPPSIRPSVRPSVRPCVRVPVRPFVRPCVHVCVYACVRATVRPSVRAGCVPAAVVPCVRAFLRLSAHVSACVRPCLCMRF